MLDGEGADLLPDAAERVAAAGGEMVGEAEPGEETGIVRGDFLRRVAAVEIAQEPGHCLHEERVGLGSEPTPAVAELRHEPELRKTALDAVGVDAEFRREQGP